MGGHGALTIAIKNPDRYCSVSALSPICNPSKSPWGIKAFSNYLGSDESTWLAYDATHLISQRGCSLPMLADVGTHDSFEEEELKSQVFIDAAKAAGIAMTFNFREGYDHGFYFVASVIDEHLRFHANYLRD